MSRPVELVADLGRCEFDPPAQATLSIGPVAELVSEHTLGKLSKVFERLFVTG